ncbi:hypothetical protein SHKM778_52340 [Streptomyces sp. KM77-8]|uniref:Tetratricopeptide repeat protein n=1 Tax=Streptomyces haneummycinicus TaxID=3074435 RepID=A0AAT9HNC8_9ACTN
MADWLEGFLAMRVHVLIRFGRWDDILDLPFPTDPELYRVTTAMLHYARGVALSATGAVDRAEAEQDDFRAAVRRVPGTRMLFNNTCSDILAIASAMLDGELAYRKGEYDTAFAALERAVALDDSLPYDEPWGWMQPTRHAYGALLLEQGRVEQAEAVYRADLGLDSTLPRPLQHPDNVWALHGFHECLLRTGKTGEAEIVAHRLRQAVALADVPVESSCYCRLETGPEAAVQEAAETGRPATEPARDGPARRQGRYAVSARLDDGLERPHAGEAVPVGRVPMRRLVLLLHSAERG